jgi:hypothetical protein
VRSNIGRLLILVVAAGLAGACASAPPQPQYTPGSIDPDYWVKKVDQFALIGDGSLSMSDKHEKMLKLDIAQAVLDSMNQTIPEKDYNGTFVAFGRGECGSSGKTVLAVPLAEYSKGAFNSAIDNYDCAGGNNRGRLDFGCHSFRGNWYFFCPGFSDNCTSGDSCSCRRSSNSGGSRSSRRSRMPRTCGISAIASIQWVKRVTRLWR